MPTIVRNNCLLCCKGFERKVNLILHEKEQHKIVCSKCEYLFYYKYDLKMNSFANHAKAPTSEAASINFIVLEQNTVEKPVLEC